MLTPWDGGQARSFLPDFPCRLGCSHRSRFLKYVKPLLVVTAAVSSGQGRPPLGTLTSVVAGRGQQQWGDGPSRGKLGPLRGATSAHGVLHSVCPNNLDIRLHFHCGPSHSSRLFIYQTFIEQLSVSGESHQAPALWRRLTEKGDVSANGDGSGATTCCRSKEGGLPGGGGASEVHPEEQQQEEQSRTFCKKRRDARKAWRIQRVTEGDICRL